MRLRLRLAVAAHGAVGHDAAVAQHRQRRIERVERQPAGRQRVERAALRARSSRRGSASARRSPAARSRSRTPSRATGCRTRRGRRRRRRPSRSCRPRPAAQRPGRRLAAVDLQRLAGEEARLEIAVERMRQAAGSVTTRSRTAERALGRLDQAVDVIEAFGLRHAQALEQREDHQRGEALGRRRRCCRACRRADRATAARRGGLGSASRSARVTGLPMRSRSAAISRPTSPR